MCLHSTLALKLREFLLRVWYVLADSSAPSENVNTSHVLDRLLDASMALLASIQKLEDMVQRQHSSFQALPESKIAQAPRGYGRVIR